MPYVTPPDWLVEGMLALQPGRVSDNDAELLRSIVASKRISPLENIVRQRRAQLDAPSRQLHEAYARALVQLLLDVPGGRLQGSRSLSPTCLMRLTTPWPICRRIFRRRSGTRRAKWWALSVAQLSAMDRYETLSAEDTVAQLDRILRFSIPAPDGQVRDYSLGDYKTFPKLPASRAVLRQVGQQLLLLGVRAHPSYRAIVQEDYELAEMLARGKTHWVPERLERVANYRAVIERQRSAVDDYLNWYEATHSNTTSGAFSEILETADEALPRRRDAISVYLDSLEMQTN
jgi:hypothetical protein